MVKQIKAVATSSNNLSSSLGLIRCGRKNRLSQAVTSTHTLWQAHMHTHCAGWFSIAVTKTWPTPSWKGKVYFILHFHFTLHIEGSHDGNTSSNLEEGNEAKAMEGGPLLLGLLSLNFIQPRTTCLGVIPPTVGLAISSRLLIKRMPYRIDYRHSLNWL